jgi:SAM-dependent methyltransferase
VQPSTDTDYSNARFSSRPAAAADLAHRTIGLIRDRPDPLLLDLGCGTAAVAIAAAREHPQLRAIGLDVSLVNAQAAREVVHSAGLGERVTIICADYFAWAGPPVDAIASDSVLHLMEVSDAELAERLTAGLKPGGFLVATLPVESPANQVRVMLRRIWRRLPRSIDKLVLRLARRVYRDFSEQMLAERIPYLRVRPRRLFGPALTAEFARHGLVVVSHESWGAPRIAKLTHDVVIWRKT